MLSEGIKGALDFINGALEEFDWQACGYAIADFLSSIDYIEITRKLGTMLGNAIGGVSVLIATAITNLCQNIANWIKEKMSLGFKAAEEGGYNVVVGFLAGIGNMIIGIAEWIWENFIKPFVDAFKKQLGINSPSTVFMEFGKDIVLGLINGIVSLIQTVIEKFIEIKTKITEKMEETKNNISEKTSQIKQDWSEKWNSIKQNSTEIVQNIKDNISNKFDETKNNVQQKIEDIRKGIVDKFTNAKNSAVNIFDDLKTGVTNAFSNIWTSIKGTINNILSGIESMVNGGLSGLSSFINGIGNKVNSLSKYTGFSVPSVSFSSVSLPRLETGGVLYDETVFVGGEYSNASSNPEIIAPEDLLYKTQIRALNDSNFSNSDDTGLQKIVVNILGRQLIYDIAELLNLQKIIDGEALLEVD